MGGDGVPVPTIHHIRIEKFRRIRDVLELDLRTPRGRPSSLTVIAGPNGCGKTSVLEAVLLGLGQEDLIVRDIEASEREGSWRATVPEGARIQLTVSLDVRGGREETWVRTRDEHYRIRDDDSHEDLLDYSAGIRGSLLVEYFSSWRAPALVGAVKPQAAGRRPANNETNRLWRLKQRFADEYIRVGMQRTVAGSAVNKPAQWLQRINRAWRRFHQNDGTTIEAELVDRQEGALVDLAVMQGNERICSVDQLSSGEIEVLVFEQWIILNEIQAGLLLIDEPELHLHASWQATILPALRDLAPRIQILAATHSDAVWDQASERFLLVDENDPRSQEWRKAHALPRDEEAAS